MHAKFFYIYILTVKNIFDRILINFQILFLIAAFIAPPSDIFPYFAYGLKTENASKWTDKRRPI